jgi:phosphatidylglycerophosphatase A
MKTRSAWILATWFGCGLAPKGPGTAGSLGAIALACLCALHPAFRPWHLAIAALLLLPAALWAAGRVALESGRPDPQLVVVDEVLGQWLTLAVLPELTAWPVLAAFLLFRLFDIFKPPPLRQLERLPGGAGIIADDLMAGVYGALVMLAAGPLLARF